MHPEPSNWTTPDASSRSRSTAVSPTPPRSSQRTPRPRRFFVRYDDGVDDVSAFVLAGGRSSRMGTDKALLSMGSENLLQRTLRNVSAVCSTPIIIGDPV